MKNFKWEGVMPAITTQFDSEGALSLNAFKNNLAHQIKAGVHGRKTNDNHSLTLGITSAIPWGKTFYSCDNLRFN